MHHSFSQKLIITVLAGALTAAFYVFFYEGIILEAQRSANSGPASIR